MNLLRTFERRLRDRIEGLFSIGAAGVQPVELGEWLTEEMDEQRMVGKEKVYAPAEFTVYLGPDDTKSLGPYLDTLAKELSQLLYEHSTERGYSIAHVPQVRFARRDALPEGEVDIETRLAEPGETSGTTKVFSAEELADMKAATAPAYLEAKDGTRFDLVGDVMQAGRLATNPIAIDDINVSRTHCVFEKVDGRWRVRDLASTNGVRVNGHKVTEQVLEDGDLVSLGTTVLTFYAG